MYKILNHHTLKVTCTNDWAVFSRQVPLLLGGNETVLSHLRTNLKGESIVVFEKFLQELFNLPLVSLWYDDKNPVFLHGKCHPLHDFTLTGHEKDDKKTMLEARLLFFDPERILEVRHVRVGQRMDSLFRLEIHGAQSHLSEPVSDLIHGLLHRAETLDTLIEEL